MPSYGGAVQSLSLTPLKLNAAPVKGKRFGSYFKDGGRRTQEGASAVYQTIASIIVDGMLRTLIKLSVTADKGNVVPLLNLACPVEGREPKHGLGEVRSVLQLGLRDKPSFGGEAASTVWASGFSASARPSDLAMARLFCHWAASSAAHPCRPQAPWPQARARAGDGDSAPDPPSDLRADILFSSYFIK